MIRFHVTYEIVTPESAEHGDAEEIGFVTPGAWHYSVEQANRDDCAMSLREAVDLVSCCEDSGSWFSEYDSRCDYRTGAEERRSLHPPENITPASYRRIGRLLKA